MDVLPIQRDQPDFGNYDLGASFAYNFSRIVGVEGDVGGSLGVKQDIDMLTGGTVNVKTPNIPSYVGNVIVNLPGRSVVPYATGGVGGPTLYEREIPGIANERVAKGRSKAARREQSITALSGMVGAMVVARLVNDSALSNEILTVAAAAFGGNKNDNQKRTAV